MGSTTEKRAAVLAALEDIVASDPEKVSDCYYFDFGDSPDEPNAPAPTVPVCVIGHLIHRLEPETFKTMIELSETTVPSMPSILVEKLRDYGIRLSFDQDHDLIWALGVLQGEQDSGKTWAEALKSFKQTLASMDA